MPPLKNLRQETFCREYLKDSDMTRAYRMAGYTPANDNTCASCASQLLKKTNIQQRMKELAQAVATRAEASAARTIVELARIGTSDIRKVVGRDGCIMDPSEWDDDTAAAVSSIKTEKLFEGKGKDRKHVGYTQELKLWDKNSALTNLAKHFKLLGLDDPAGDTYNTQINFYMPSNERDPLEPVPNGSNGHANGST